LGSLGFEEVLMRSTRHKGTLWVVLLLAGSLSHLGLYGQTTGSKRNVQDARLPAASGVQPGPYYALVIGNKNYRYVKPLETPINDANAVVQLLRDSFGFQTKVLLDADRSQIMTALVEYRTRLPENSNLLIYYAGHGHHDPDTDEAYWLPIDAQRDNNANWVSADDVTRDVRAMLSVQHVLVISDSCYAGYMTRDAGVALNPADQTAYVAKMLKSKSRNLMSSGGDEPVADSGAPGHSVFASAVLESLRQMDKQQFTAADVFYTLIQPRVGGKSEQTPQYSWIRNSGHDAGDFVFVRHAGTSAAAVPSATLATAPQPTTTSPPTNAATLPAGMDPTLAELYQRAQAGNPRAMFEVGLDYRDGKGTPQDIKLAGEWFRKAAEAGDPAGMINLGHMYETGQGVQQDYQQAVSWYRKAVEAGDARGMSNLGAAYESGHGVQQDHQQAVSWFRKAAQAGDARGMIGLGYMYETGHGVQQEYQQAVSWYRKAVEAGDARGMSNLGVMYEAGRGVQQDYQQAVSWYHKAVEAGDARGMINLGYMYETGHGVPLDSQQAVSWYRKAVEAGNGAGMRKLGHMYETGQGVQQDYQQAVSWYRKAIEAGDAGGMRHLGAAYETGHGVPRDEKQAISWYRKAAQLGDQLAKNALIRLGENPQ
jgi:TPR repeat protein